MRDYLTVQLLPLVTNLLHVHWVMAHNFLVVYFVVYRFRIHYCEVNKERLWVKELNPFPAHSHPSHCVDAIVIPQPSGESSGTNPSGATPRLSDGSSGTTPSGATPGPSGESTQPSSYDQLQLFERCYEESYDVYEYQDYLSWLEIPTSWPLLPST